jgi:hypothetical protein
VLVLVLVLIHEKCFLGKSLFLYHVKGENVNYFTTKMNMAFKPGSTGIKISKTCKTN